MNKIILLDIIILFTIFVGILSININDRIEGNIKSVDYGNNKITIYLNNKENPIIVFENSILNLKNGDTIIAYGKNDLYRQKQQLIAEKIVKITN